MLALIYFLTFKGAAASVTISNDSLEIKTEHIKLVLKRHPTGSIYLKNLSLTGQMGLIREPADNIEKWKICPLWNLSFVEPDLKFNSNSAQFVNWQVNYTDSSYITELLWNYTKNELNISINVFIEILWQNPNTLWRMDINSNNESAFMLQKNMFPIIGDFHLSGKSGNIRLAYPKSWGREYFRAEDVNIAHVYPSSGCQMQFAAYYNDRTNEGLYFCARDIAGYQKLLGNHKGNPKIPFARFEPSVIPSPVKTLYWISPYENEIRPFEGNWYEASKFYRDWVTNSAHFTTPNKERKNKWIFETDFWFRSGPLSDTTSNFLNTVDLKYIKLVKDYFDVNTAVHLYNWHRFPFDDRYPQYFPPRPGLENFLRILRNNNIKVVPYINGRIADLRLIETNSHYAQSVCIYDYLSFPNYFIKNYHGNDFGFICPSTSVWQDTLFQISKKLIDIYNFDGVYYDQVCNNQSIKCLNAKHGHKPDAHNLGNYSSGTHWVKGFRKLLKQIVELKKSDNDFVLSTEDAAEPWNDLFDVFLMFNSRSTDPENSFHLIPLYPAVYSGYTTTMGFQYMGMNPGEWLNTLLSKLARGFIWGSQIGWMKPETVYRNKTLLDYLKNLLQARRLAHYYINFGEMKKPPKILPEEEPEIVEESAFFHHERHLIKFPVAPIQISYWELNADSAAILMTNFTENNYNDNGLKLRLNLKDSRLKKGGFLIYGLDNGIQEVEITDDNLELNFRIRPFESKFMEILSNK